MTTATKSVTFSVSNWEKIKAAIALLSDGPEAREILLAMQEMQDHSDELSDD